MIPLLLIVLRQAAVAVETRFDPATGIYQVTDRATGWSFLGQALGTVSDVRNEDGRDSIGAYHEIQFAEDAPSASASIPVLASIRTYEAVRAVKFRLEYRKSSPGNGINFPDFSAFPKSLHEFSYRDSTFAPYTFGLAQTATPWLLFDDTGRSFVFSPASEFMISRMAGDGKTSLAEGFDPRLAAVRPGLAQESLLAFGSHIGDTWNEWGAALRALHNRQIPAPESDPVLKSFGYWTDNGADYYYNYDPENGYAGTLLALRNRYRESGIPLGYLQLDSWWYSKTVDDPGGKPGGATKNAKLPAESWNRYGGLYEYRAHPSLFPDGLEAFRRRLGLPLVVHNRWMDRTSPYHRDYRISGIAVTDRRWWQATGSYLASSGVTCYEQDWLNPIYANSPEMASEVGVGDAFADGMAAAMAKNGLTVEYCMATPRFFLQGVGYPNLTTIRTSDDRFEPRKWREFLYGSQFAQAVGIWPWCDVFKSGETGNMIVDSLSAGPVGTGDAMGKESHENILKAARPDGVLVKPDRSLLPCERTYIDGANHRVAPFWADTYTDHDGLRTSYLFAFSPPNGRTTQEVSGDIFPREFGVSQPAYVFDYLTEEARPIKPDEPIHVDTSDYAYRIIAPITKSGIVFFGDLGKWIPTGKQRIAAIDDRADGLRVRVLFARGEPSVTLDGTSPLRPTVRARDGAATLAKYDESTKRWTLTLTPFGKSQSVDVYIDQPRPAGRKRKPL